MIINISAKVLERSKKSAQNTHTPNFKSTWHYEEESSEKGSKNILFTSVCENLRAFGTEQTLDDSETFFVGCLIRFIAQYSHVELTKRI